jgi:hypothetical protein
VNRDLGLRQADKGLISQLMYFHLPPRTSMSTAALGS